ncbi:nucleotide-binding universal stress UspA family protein [Isoptericola jiangsuensis]|uniref:Nucleotide-binding universal stress UspA family protein n=1 Tax=Isoptericola jiangsuensis TaxID=548579 RepID=A0A2A9EUJ4_9MICO|nr:universal stress protein [Isoptericola jiangsuensis]PFG41960.1 nucleotide-binding universal stress UspA family protein [Isoptericola jiangsuensis]
MDGIVVGVNGSAEADEALDWALTEAASRGVGLTVVQAAPERDAADLEPVRAERLAGTREIVDRAAARHGVDVDVDVVCLPGPAPEALLTAAHGAVMLVLGRRRRGRVGRRVLGSVSTTVAENADVPVTVVRRLDDGPTPELVDGAEPRVVVGVDTSVPSVAALRHGAEVAERIGAVLEPVFAWQITTLAPLPGSWGWAPPIDDYERFARDCLDAAVRDAGVSLPAERVRPQVLHGQAAKMLVEAATGADRLVVGTRGLGGFDRLVLGSTSRQVLDFAPCPVTVLRR